MQDIKLEHCSVVMSSSKTNSDYEHRICGKGNWRGVTFRLSKTFVEYTDNGLAYLLGPKRPLLLATKEQVLEFRKQKSLENEHYGLYKYPDIDFTISCGDLINLEKM